MKKDITQEELKSMFDYDSENGWLIRKFRFGKLYNKPCGHKPASRGYGKIKINREWYATHRLIWLYHYGEWPSEFIDHIDGNKVNNRIENLREVNQQANCHNYKILKKNTSGFPNVYWHESLKKYRVRIEVSNKPIHIGYYSSYEESVLVAMIAKIEHHPSSPQAKEYFKELTYSS